MGRAPCCDKANVKKGPWSPEEDAKLKSHIEQHGTGGNWIALPQKIGLKRCGKSCRLRWLNYLRPNLKHGGFSEEEDNIICSLYISIGSRWSIIAAQLPGRTDNDIKNYWNTRLKKKLLGNNKQRKNNTQQQTAQTVASINSTGQLIKHEITKRGIRLSTVNSMEAMMNTTYSNSVVNIDNQSPYWPELPFLTPTPYSDRPQPRCNDHESIRKLLIKLGGRFSNNDRDIDHDPAHLFPFDHNNQRPYELITPGFGSQVQYNNSQILQGQSSATAITDSFAEIEESATVYNNNSGQVLNGLEFFYGNNISGNVHDRRDMGWEDTGSLVYSSVSENYEGAQRCIFGESSSPKAQ